VNEFPPYELNSVLVPICQEFRYLPVAATWEPGISTLHTYMSVRRADSLHDLFHCCGSQVKHWKTWSGWALKFAHFGLVLTHPCYRIFTMNPCFGGDKGTNNEQSVNLVLNLLQGFLRLTHWLV
jgi:hypothetical protein